MSSESAAPSYGPGSVVSHEERSRRAVLSRKEKWTDMKSDFRDILFLPRRMQLDVTIWWQKKLSSMAFYAVKYPMLVIVACLTLTVLLGSGMVFLKTESNMDKLWVPMDIPAWKNEQYIESAYGAVSDVLTTLFISPSIRSGGLVAGVLTKSLLLEVYDVHSHVLTDMNYGDICVRNGAGASCSVHSLFSLWSHDRAVLESRSQSEILSDVKGLWSELNWSLGGCEHSLDGSLVGCKAVRMVYDVSGEEDVESDVLAFYDAADSYFPSVSLSYDATAHHIHDLSVENEIARTVNEDMELVSVSIILALGYMTISISRLSWTQTKVALGATSVVTILCSLVMAGGVAGYAGITSNPIVPLTIFILTGIGVDDMIIIVDSFNNTPSNARTYDRIEQTMCHAGNAITLTSLTDFAVFSAGFFWSPFPGVVQFSFFAAFSILALFFLQLTFFMACLTLDAKRVIKGRPEFFPCISCKPSNRRGSECLPVEAPPKSEEPVSPPETKESHNPNMVRQALTVASQMKKAFLKWVRSKYLPEPEESGFHYTVRRYYSPVITNPCVAVTTVIVFVGVACFALFLLIAVTPSIGAPIQDMMDPQSSPTLFLDETETYFTNVAGLSVVIKGMRDGSVVNYTSPAVQDALVETAQSFRDMEQTVGSFNSWFDDFLVYNNGTAPSTSMFYPTLYDFLTTEKYKHYTADIVFRRGVIYSSRFTGRMVFDHSHGATAHDRYVDMRATTDLAESNEVFEVISHAFNFKWLERDNRILADTITNIAIATVVVWISLLLFLHPYIALLTVVTVVLIDIDLFGIVMVVFDVPMDTVSYVALSIAVTLSVDYSAHLGVSYYHAQGKSRRMRTRKALSEIGTSVFAGGFSTFLGVLVLAFAKSGAFRTFFFMMMGITVAGLAHGLVFFPALLVLAGWKAQYPAEVGEADEEDLVEVTLEDIQKKTKKVGFEDEADDSGADTSFDQVVSKVQTGLSVAV